MCLFGDLISALTVFFVLLAVAGLGISMHETAAFFFLLVIAEIAEMLKILQVREQMGMY